MANDKTVVLVDGQAPPRFIPSTRFTLALLVFFAFIVQYSQRVNLPIAIVCMVNRTKPIDQRLSSNFTFARTNSFQSDAARPLSFSSTTTKRVPTAVQKGGFFEEKQFNWIELQQQMLLGGYWAGYIFTQVPGKQICSHSRTSDRLTDTLRWLAGNVDRRQVGLRRFAEHELTGDTGHDRDVHYVKYGLYSHSYSARDSWPCAWRPLSCHHCPLVRMGRSSRAKHTRIHWILRYTSRHIADYAERRSTLPLFRSEERRVGKEC